MPIYEFVCAACERHIEAIRNIADRDGVYYCECGEIMERIYSVPALAIWNAERSFPQAVKTGDGKFPTKAAYETHLKVNDMAETRTDGRNKSLVPRSMRKT